MKKSIASLILFLAIYANSYGQLSTTDSIKIAMYHAGVNLRNYDMCHGLGISTQAAGALIIAGGYLAQSGNKETSNSTPAAVYVGGALVLMGGVINLIAPSYVGKAGLNLKGIGFTWDIPNPRKNKEAF